MELNGADSIASVKSDPHSPSQKNMKTMISTRQYLKIQQTLQTDNKSAEASLKISNDNLYFEPESGSSGGTSSLKVIKKIRAINEARQIISREETKIDASL